MCIVSIAAPLCLLSILQTMKSFQIYLYSYFGINLLGRVGAFSPTDSRLTGTSALKPQTQRKRLPSTNAFGTAYPTCGAITPTSLNIVAPAAILSVAIPSAKTILGTTLLPTCLGYYRYEYGVSYGYGTATAATAFLVFRALQTTHSSVFGTMAQIHALAIVFYGLRLNFFLLYREIVLERFRRMRETIEDRQRKKEDGKGLIGKMINRTPFILGCAFLYAGLAAPPLVSATLIEMAVVPSCGLGVSLYKALVGCTWFG